MNHAKPASNRFDLYSFSIRVIFMIMPFVDLCNGYFQSIDLHFSIGLLYRALSILILVVLMANKLRGTLFRDCLLAILILSSLTCCHVLLGTPVLNEIYYLLTWLTFPIYFLILVQARKLSIIDTRTIESILNFYLWVVPLTILIPWALGLGHSTYSSGEGYKGFYLATNGISFYLGSLMIYSSWMLYMHFSIKRIFQTAMLLAACLLLGTMSSIGSIAIALIVLFLLVIKNASGNILLRIAVVTLTCLLIFFFAVLFSSELNETIQRRLYFLTNNTTGLMDFVTSGRLTLFVDNWHLAFQNKPLQTSLIGFGVFERECEFDYFDYFLTYGLLGVVAISMVLLHIRLEADEFRSLIFKIIIAYAFVYAGLVGHVFTNAMSSMLLALFVSCTEFHPSVIFASIDGQND